MAAQTDMYRQNALKARAEADAATLDNVRDRALRSEAAWTAMADRYERVDNARADREARSPADHLTQDTP